MEGREEKSGEKNRHKVKRAKRKRRGREWKGGKKSGEKNRIKVERLNRKRRGRGWGEREIYRDRLDRVKKEREEGRIRAE